MQLPQEIRKYQNQCYNMFVYYSESAFLMIHGNKCLEFNFCTFTMFWNTSIIKLNVHYIACGKIIIFYIYIMSELLLMWKNRNIKSWLWMHYEKKLIIGLIYWILLLSTNSMSNFFEEEGRDCWFDTYVYCNYVTWTHVRMLNIGWGVLSTVVF